MERVQKDGMKASESQSEVSESSFEVALKQEQAAGQGVHVGICQAWHGHAPFEVDHRGVRTDVRAAASRNTGASKGNDAVGVDCHGIHHPGLVIQRIY